MVPHTVACFSGSKLVVSRPSPLSRARPKVVSPRPRFHHLSPLLYQGPSFWSLSLPGTSHFHTTAAGHCENTGSRSEKVAVRKRERLLCPRSQSWEPRWFRTVCVSDYLLQPRCFRQGRRGSWSAPLTFKRLFRALGI